MTGGAHAAGRFAEEIAPVSIAQRKGDALVVSQDEFPKPGTTLEALSGLRPAFRKDGTVTAGNASGLNDGSAAVLLATAQGIKDHNLAPLARVVAGGVAGVEPRTMGIGPVPATQKALAKAGLSLKDIDVIELNEAFAAQALACTRALGLDDRDDRINPNGGAIALGHPLGCTGAKLTVQLLNELKARGGKHGVVTMCVGTGQGAAGVIEML
jgi:acetyl-CoA acetyltransferase family protein